MWVISSSTSARVTTCRSKAKEMSGELHFSENENDFAERLVTFWLS